ncbi:MAG: MATE family efflux transporter [Nitrospira sp.]|nr:MATE family efflux transporter [Nitrospira sp.]MDW7655248.1 MATE family efflux transporter [Nitrospiraceae bacterium]MBP0120755.1 MATE family efflux transporter [Nitrospira sp.]MBP0124908.1 MATE family efflux transporter [Nitrospira sp.]MBP0127751.1 MATE family efflux transporter [Nitrospira sp.]
MASRIAQIRKSVLTLALPVTVSSLLQRTEGIAAVFLVGGLGATSIAAVGLSQLLAFMSTTLVSGLSVGANVLIAQLWGARRTKDVGEAATHLLGLAALVSCGLVLLGLSLNRLTMELLGAEQDVIALALPYSNLIFLVIPCTIFLQVLSSIMQGTGDTKTPMYALIGVNLIYLTIAYPLVYGLWGFPAWGLTGAAVATGLAEGTGVLYLLWANRRVFKRSLVIRRDLMRSTWQIGAPVSGERIFQQAGIIIYTKVVLLYGTVTYAAHQVGLSIESLSFLPGYGFAIAAATMVGQSIGAGKYVRSKLENWEANRLASTAMAAMGVLFFFFPYILLRAFTHDEAVIELGTVFLRIVAVLQVPLALTMVLAGSLRGAGDTRFIMLATTIGMWGVRVPLAITAGPWLAMDVLYVWSAMIADWTVRMALLLWRYRSEQWKTIRVFR